MQPLAATAAAAQAYYGVGGGMIPGYAAQNQVFYYQQATQPGHEVIAQAATAAAAAVASTNEKKRSLDGVDQFFDDAKRHKLQPVYDGNMAQRLSALQFPSTTGEAGEFNGITVTAPAANGPGGQQFTLPSLRTKQDIIDADNFLTQLSANVYETAAQGHGYPYRGQHQQHPSQGPPSHHESPAPPASMAPATQAPTPPGSNYTTSHSPGTHHTTPTTVSPQTSNSTTYPSLPTLVSSDSNGYPAPVSSAPASSLGSQFSAQRRYDIPVLRKAQDSSSSTTPTAASTAEEIANSLIDPSLNSYETPAPPPKSAPAEEVVVDDKTLISRDSELLSNLHQYIKKLLETHTDDQEQDAEMTDIVDQEQVEETEKEREDREKRTKAEQEAEADAQALYPLLKELKAVAAC